MTDLCVVQPYLLTEVVVCIEILLPYVVCLAPPAGVGGGVDCTCTCLYTNLCST